MIRIVLSTVVAYSLVNVALADDHLQVREGLEFWYDADQIARTVSESEVSRDGGMVRIAAWPDASGKNRHALQSNLDAQPHLIQIGESQVVRFDGVDDYLRITGIDCAAEAATVFVVAAPHKNAGSYRAFLAANSPQQSDFVSGFTLDQGSGATQAFNTLNVEGPGFGGAQNLLRSVTPFSTLHVIETAISPSQQLVKLSVDGIEAGTRPFEPNTLSLAELTIGARYYGFGNLAVQGCTAGDIAEILIYSRELTTAELSHVREYLLTKHAKLKDMLPSTVGAIGIQLESVTDPPPVQVLVPGFTARELPIELPNINNVRYRPDGKLVALAYNGDIYLLHDSDGDGVEERATKFWENQGRIRSPIGMALTPPGYVHGAGVFIASKSECMLITDTNGDDRADTEITVATGWSESFHNVDALGVAVDPKDHSIYFGLGTANFADPYVRDEQGKVTYRLDGERSSILRVSPDFSQREVFCTGVRFPVALAFNRQGDLFCTDQEGATWVPNGNPLDELLHVQAKRHYGFPPRHPVHLPDVIDEPSTFDYGPQHQSTCGLAFNDPVVAGGPIFGPSWWAGDAFVCGYSRGKVWRTKLVKTPAGYIAQNQLFACLNMLTVDCCFSPGGEMVIATHSGGPDWGSGPSGNGKLYKLTYEDRQLPQPVATWAAARDEVRIAFDRPLSLGDLQGLAAATRITYGEPVRAGDEYESLRPGYEVVARQLTTPRFELKVHGAQVTADRRTLILTTDPHRNATWFAIRLPGLGRPPLSTDEPPPTAPLPQYPTIDLEYTLGGIAVDHPVDATVATWLPHLDQTVNRQLTATSASHRDLLRPSTDASTVKRLRLKTQLDLHDMLRPAIQPGSKLDYELPPEIVQVHFTAPVPYAVRTSAGVTTAQFESDRFVAKLTHSAPTERWMPIEIELEGTTGFPDLTIAWSTAEDPRRRPFPLHRLLQPWPQPPGSVSEFESERQARPELAGGSWARGRKLFFSETALCSRCHAIHGQGETIGPDLSNLLHRDYASVLRDVMEPSYAINPDYVTHNVLLSDGRALNGTLRSDGDRLLISDSQGRVTVIDRAEIEQTTPSAKSIMPEQLLEKLGSDGLRDLMTYLLTPPPQMPLEGGPEPPTARSRSEIATVLEGAPNPPEPVRPIKVVLVAGPKDHGPAEHDYPAWQTAWHEWLAVDEHTEVDVAWEWPNSQQLATADVLVFYQKGDWDLQREQDLDRYLKRGGGLVYIHYAVDGGQNPSALAERIGLAWRGGTSKFRHGRLDLDFTSAAGHPIARNFSRVDFVDESYWQLIGNPARVRLLATGAEDGQQQPLFWTYEPSKGRVFVSIPGHFSWTFDDPLFRILILRGIAWTADQPIDRFNHLIDLGARIAN